MCSVRIIIYGHCPPQHEDNSQEDGHGHGEFVDAALDDADLQSDNTSHFNGTAEAHLSYVFITAGKETSRASQRRP